ncbi:lysophospholipid acyltransferase family protein [Acidobacteriota bacterium]
MKYLVSIYVWIVGGLYFFCLCFITIFSLLFLKPKTYDPFLKGSLKLLFKLIFVKVRVEGQENLDPDLTYLFMANHVSLFDIPLLAAYIPTFVRGVEALRQFKWPVYGWAIRRLGNIPIDRKNIHASIRSIKKTERVLKSGTSIAILPEGHRTIDGKLSPFKKLPFHLAKQAKVPILPIGLSGLFQLKSRDSSVIRPGPITIRFGKPVLPEEIEKLSKEDLNVHIFNQIAALIDPVL